MKQEESSVMRSGTSQARTEGTRHTFPKSARLRHRTLVNALFDKGKPLFVYPLRCQWRVLGEEELKDSFRDSVPDGIGPVQLMVTVPKKKRRHAVDRVRMRRLVKEAYRIRRHTLAALVESRPEWRTLSIAMVYVADRNENYATVDKKMDMLIRKLSSVLEKEKISGKREDES